MNPPANNFDWSLARQLAQYADRAYREATVTAPATDTQALVTTNGDSVIVAFRGSATPHDFIQDAKFDMHPVIYSPEQPPIKIHGGFLQSFESIGDAVVEQVNAALDTLLRNVTPYPKIYVTGHSLGGAIAILCALEFTQLKLPVAGVITFGQPRVGNAAFRDFYNERLEFRTFHVVNANDPVPMLPPLLFGYRDEGQEIYLPGQSGWVLNPSIGFQIGNDLLGALASWRRARLAFLPNHFMARYLERIQSA